MKKFIKNGFVVIVVLSMLLSNAFAADALSDDKEVTVKGYDYRYWSVISNNQPGEIYAQTTVCSEGEKEAPEGYFGGQARIYNSNGVLKKSSEWKYNTIPAIVPYVIYETNSGYYYSKGQARFYTGDGYITYACTATPNYAPNKIASDYSAMNIQRNENGEIYGSELFLSEIGVQPDLILAEGANGEIGYVRAEDINDSSVTTPQEAILKMEDSTTSIIPLYSSDGVTVIGSFILEPVENEDSVNK